jgi:cob(I)alamin adenosyltransferase
MSSGFSPSDVVSAAKLACNLYKVLKDCPEDVEKISRDLVTVYGILNQIKEDLDTSESTIKAHGEHRIRLLETMVRDLNKTLNKVNKMVEQYRHLGRADGKSTVNKKDLI